MDRQAIDLDGLLKLRLTMGNQLMLANALNFQMAYGRCESNLCRWPNHEITASAILVQWSAVVRCV